MRQIARRRATPLFALCGIALVVTSSCGLESRIAEASGAAPATGTEAAGRAAVTTMVAPNNGQGAATPPGTTAEPTPNASVAPNPTVIAGDPSANPSGQDATSPLCGLARQFVEVRNPSKADHLESDRLLGEMILLADEDDATHLETARAYSTRLAGIMDQFEWNEEKLNEAIQADLVVALNIQPSEQELTAVTHVGTMFEEKCGIT